MNPTQVKPRVRFGAFELDVRAGELRKSGLKIKLQPQPLQVLLLLLERPGEVFTREELRRKLWQADVYVDFERSLNKALVKLRESLGDSAEAPRYIETLPRVGYRFIAPVEEINGSASGATPTPPAPEIKYNYLVSVRGNGEKPLPSSGEGGDNSHVLGINGAPEAVGTAMDASLPQAVAPGLAPATLDRAGASSVETTRPPQGAASRRHWPGLAIGTPALVVALALAYLFRPTLPPPQILSSTQITNDGQNKDGIVSDGARLYYTILNGRGLKIYQVSTAGGPAAPVETKVENPSLMDLSPDHSQLLVCSMISALLEHPLYAAPLLGGSTRQLNGLSAGSAVWSPDGQHLFYSRGNNVYVANADGTASRKLATVEGVAFSPRWSPDGKVIRFSVQVRKFEGSSIWEISADGNGLHQLLPGWNQTPSECCGTWTPEGKYFFFQSGKGGTGNIWAIREGRSTFYNVNHQPVRLTTGPAESGAPLASLDGKKLFVITAQFRGKLVRYDTRTGGLLPYLNGISAVRVDFSRDKQWVAYVHYPEATLWRSKIDGSDALQLTFSPMLIAQPRWSPDGNQIAFAGITPDQGRQVYLIAADGTGMPQPIPRVPGEEEAVSPGWSADGNSLVFAGPPPFGAPKSNPNTIHIMDTRTQTVTTLAGSEGLFATHWSPDGRYIAALTNDSRHLKVYDLRASKWSDLGVNFLIGSPEWSRDGQAIYFLRVQKGQPYAIFRVRLDSHRMEQVANLANFHMAITGGGTWLGLAPDNSPLLFEDAGTQDIYALDLKLP
ncbi:MAG: winged helix-turn-helix domain-containing protein [Terriglobia bacterium]